MVLALGLLIAIFVILDAYNGEQTRTWKGSINLSALIATLSTISRIALGAVTSEIISQDKWSLFGVPKKLSNLEKFDQASRGPWGTFLLLRTSLKKPYLLVTLVVALISVAMGPFPQQAVVIEECTYVSEKETATIPNMRTLGDIHWILEGIQLSVWSGGTHH